jgi:hypothetical protein
VGANTVTLTVIDLNNNSSTCTSTVTVEDNVAPVALCQNVTVTLDATGNGSITAGNVNSGSSDACGIASISASPTAFTCADVGANTVTLTVTDVNNNVSTCTSTVTVVENTAPVAICQNLTIQLDVTGNVSITPADVNNGSSDNCAIANLAISQSAFTCANVGPNVVTLTVTDVNNNSSTCQSVVTVQDNVAPVASCQNITVQLDAIGNASITAADVNNGSNDNCGIASLSVNPNTFNCTNVGANTVTLTVTDVNNNVTTCTSTVTVEDNVAPIALCQNITIALDASGNASITPADVNNGSSANCGIASLSVSPNSFNCSNVGANTVTLTVTDQNNNVTTCTSTVTVEDNTAPIAVCQNLTLQLDVTGNASTTAAAVNNGSSDNCAIANLVLSQTAFTCGDVGNNAVTLTLTDVNSNVSTCTATITVQDNIAPVANCQNITVQLDASGDAQITPLDINNGSSDACGIISLSLDNYIFSCGDVGVNPVVLTVTDFNGNVSTCNATVTVEDNVAPIAVCQDITVLLDNTGNASIVPGNMNGGSTDACGISGMTIDISTFTCADVGPNTVTLTVTDVNNNVSSCTGIATVLDIVDPIAVCQNVTVQLDATGNGTVTAQDIDNGSSDACGIATLALTGQQAFTCADVGVQNIFVFMTVTDVNNNTSICSSVITVEDTVPPVALCQDITVQLDVVGNASITPQDVDNGSNDACGIASLSVNPNTFTCANVGPNTVILTVTDVNNNVSTCSSIVTVEDTIPPVALCQDITVQLDAIGNGSITAQDIDNGSNDACGIASISANPTTFTCANVGPNTVTLTVTDVNNNVSTCTSVVTVEDTVPPVALCQDLTVQLDAIGNGSITPQDVDNGSNDACGIASLSVNPNTFTCADVGANTVTLTVTDVNNNVSTCTSIITVEDTIPPVAICQSITINLPPNGPVTVSAQDIDNGSNDACGIASLVLNPNTFDCTNQGVNTVTLTVTDVNNNVSTCSATVTVTVTPLVATVTSPTFACGYNISCKGNNDGSATVNVTGGCLPYTYLWSNGQTTQTAVNLIAGTYTVTVTDQNSNTTTGSVTLTQPAELAVVNITSPTFPGGTNISCNGGNDGSIDLSVFGGADCQAYTYSWTGPGGFTANTEDLSNLFAGTYNVTVTDANGCIATGTITLTEPTVLVADAGGNGSISTCSNSPVALGGSPTATGGSPGYTYLWTPATGLNSATVANPVVTTIGTTIYTVTVTDINGCVASDQVSVTVFPALNVTINQSTLSTYCQGAAVNLTANAVGGTGVYSYLWSTTETTSAIQIAQSGTYSVVVTDSIGCVANATIQVTINPQTLASAYSIIGFDEVRLNDDVTVVNGGIGVKQPGNRIRVQNNSIVTSPTTFAMSSVVQIQGGSVVSTVLLNPSPVVVPNFLWNPYNSNNDVNVGNNQTVVLTDSIYGKVDIGKDAVVTFTQKDIFIEELKVDDDATVNFTGCTFMRVRKKVDIKRDVNFNLANFPVTIFEEESGVDIDRGSVVYAHWFTLDDFRADGHASSPTFLYGRIIAKDVRLQKNVTLDWNLDCDNTCEPSPNPVIANCGCDDKIREIFLVYNGTPGATVVAYYDNSLEDTLGIYTNVQPGDTLFVQSAADGEDRFKNTTIFQVNGGSNITVSTYCNSIALGQVNGPFTTIRWVDGDGQTCLPGAPSKAVEVATEEPSAQSGSQGMDTQRDLNLSAHPNPFSEATTVRFTVPQDDRVEIRIFNVSGQEVAVLFKGEALGNMTYDFEWRPENITNGLYTVKLVTESGQVLYKKLVLSR